MNTRDLGYIALSTALLSVSAWIAIPVGGIPITLQTLVLCLSAGLLGAKRAVLATLAYLLLGIVGVPVFAGLLGGVGVFLSPTGGFLVGFLLLSFVAGLMGEKFVKQRGNARVWLALAMGVGILLCYTIGTVWFVLLSAEGAKAGLWAALTACVLPYLPFDMVKIVFAVLLTEKLRKIIKL